MTASGRDGRPASASRRPGREPGPAVPVTGRREEAFWRTVSRHLGERRFNDEQIAAVRAPDGPVLIEAGPGSGKTTVLTWRIAYLVAVRGVEPASIRVVTFTKAAADELKARLGRIFPDGRGHGVRASTIHSMAFRMLRTQERWARWDVVQDEQVIWQVAAFLRDAGVQDVGDDTPVNVLNEMGRVRNLMMDPAGYEPETVDRQTFLRVVRAYDRWKQQKRLLDFDDMLVHLYELIAANPRRFHGWCSHLLVDEFQDTSRLQYAILKMLAAPHNNFLVVGDIDQAIYSWRGAGPEVMLQFPRDYPRARRLSLQANYRAMERLVEVTNRLIAHNEKRFSTAVRAVKPGGTRPRVITPDSDADEAGAVARVLREGAARNVPWREMAVIYRMNDQSLPFIAALAGEGIPFRILGEPTNPFRHWVGRDILSYLRLGLGEMSPALLERIIYRPNRYIGRADTAAAGRLLRRSGSVAGAYEAADVQLTDSQKAELVRLDEHLRALARQGSTREAIRFIRETVGYDGYVTMRTGGSASGSVEAMAVMSLLEMLAESRPTLDEFTRWGMTVANIRRGWWKSAALSSGSGAAVSETEADGVTLTTCHSAKGLEFDLVVVAGLVEDVLPVWGGDIEEERRLCYVAMTRAREELVLSAPGYLLGMKRSPSRFLEEALPDTRDAGGPKVDPAAAFATLQLGDRVRHTSLGEGVVVGLAPGLIEVDFDGPGRKKLDMAVCAEKGLLTCLD